jgi:hypothetical protein
MPEIKKLISLISDIDKLNIIFKNERTIQELLGRKN